VSDAGRLLAALPLLAALACLPCCDQRPAPPDPGKAQANLSPAERGRRRALADAAAGKLRVYRYGNPASFTNPRTDPESGLPARTLLDCCVTAEAREETEAYNAEMRGSAAARRDATPGVSR